MQSNQRFIAKIWNTALSAPRAETPDFRRTRETNAQNLRIPTSRIIKQDAAFSDPPLKPGNRETRTPCRKGHRLTVQYGRADAINAVNSYSLNAHKHAAAVSLGFIGHGLPDHRQAITPRNHGAP